MYIIDGIAYAGEPSHSVKVSGIKPLSNYRLWLRFDTGEMKVFDFNPLLDRPGFVPLRDKKLFDSVYIDYGIPVWQDGDIDIAPDFLYNHSIAVDTAEIA